MDKNITCDAYSFQHAYAKPKNLSFHLFPRDRKTRDQWIEAICSYRKGYVPSKTSVLCSEHFVKSDYTPRGNRVILRPSSVPTIFDFTCVKKQKAIDNHQIKLTDENKLYNFSYKSYKESQNAAAAAQLNLKLKPELLALLQKRNRPILLRRKTKQTGSKKQIPECIWIMPSGSVSASPRILIPPNCSRSISTNPFESFKARPSIKVVVPKVPPGLTTYGNKNNKKSKPNSTQLSAEEFVKEEATLDDGDIIEINELIKQEHEYCIQVERPEIEIKTELPEIKQDKPENCKEIPFIKCREQHELVNQDKTVKKESELTENVQKEIQNVSKQIENVSKEIKQEPLDVDDEYEPMVIQRKYNAIKKEPELIVPELTAELLMEQGDEESEYFEFVDVDMTDDMDYADDPLQIREELILS